VILGVEGSPRRSGNSHKLLEAVLEGAADAGQEGYAVHLRDYRYDPCVGCEQCRTEKACTRFRDGMTLLYPHVDGSTGLVLVSPVHNYNITAWMKAFIDRLYCYYDFSDTRPRAWRSRLAEQNRAAVIAAVAEQETPENLGVALEAMRLPLEAMRLPLEALGYRVVAQLPVLRLFDRGLVAKHEDVLQAAREAGRKLAEAVT
jgi:multimeric flavodoxin WrbA